MIKIHSGEWSVPVPDGPYRVFTAVELAQAWDPNHGAGY
jgi:hypothetical protein